MNVYYSWKSAEFTTQLSTLVSDVKKPESSGVGIPSEWSKSPSGILRCPAFVQSLNNTFVARSPVDYSFNVDKENGIVTSDILSQEAFDDMLLVRDAKSGSCSFNYPRFVFYSEESLDMEVSSAYYHTSDFQDKAMFMGGRYDIGKHFRFTEAAFIAKNSGTITIQNNDPIFYVKFHTKEPIKLIPFFVTRELQETVDMLLAPRRYPPNRPHPLSVWYNLHDRFYAKRILRQVKENILD